MPEIPKWVWVLILAIAAWWVIMQAVDFVGKVNTTVGKANNSMERSTTDLNTLKQED